MDGLEMQSEESFEDDMPAIVNLKIKDTHPKKLPPISPKISV